MNISELARICRISPRMLRHYDSIGLFKPAKVNEQTAYREYSGHQILVLQRILVLKDLGFSLEEIRVMVQENLSVEQTKLVLSKQKILLEQRIHEEQARLTRLELHLPNLSKEKFMFQVEIKSLPSQLVASLQNDSLVQQFAQGGQDISKLIEVFTIDLKPILVAGQPMPQSIFWHESNDYPIPELIHPIAEPFDFQYAKVKTLDPVPEAACLEFNGHYADEGMMQAYTYLHTWLEEHGFRSSGATRQMYNLHSEGVFRIELQIPVTRA
jgi:DNA-binding transcriptional MerR regulator